MRALLDKELADALDRRGLRGRPWAVEVDESAYAFLIDKGFSPELGARPLKRAVEQYLLAPLARAIVEQSVPDGDQFLFVTAPAGDRIHVAFVDPDDEPEVEADTEPSALDLKHLARAPRGDGDSVRVALAELARISSPSPRRRHGRVTCSRRCPSLGSGSATTASTCSPRRSTSSACRWRLIRPSASARGCSAARRTTAERIRVSSACSPDASTSWTGARRGRERLLHRGRGLAETVRGRSRRRRGR